MSDVMKFSPLWGEWHIKEQLGKGSFGAVYRAEKSAYGNNYESAIKHVSIPPEGLKDEDIISEGYAADSESVSYYYDYVRDQLINEINTCYKLRGNTNIVSYEDHCIIPKKDKKGYDVFIRMEYLTPLTKYMKDNSFTEKDILRLGIEMCEALSVLDKEHMIHRDIKPANIFVTDRGTYKLGDFGETKVLSNTTAAMSVRGTYTYMSPEISRGEPANITSDIYSLGIVLYRLMNGNKIPFLSADATANANMVESANIRRFKGEALPPPKNCTNTSFLQVVMKACEYLPANRWQSPKEMKKALEAVEENRPIDDIMPVYSGSNSGNMDGTNSVLYPMNNTIQNGGTYRGYPDQTAYGQQSIQTPYAQQTGNMYQTGQNNNAGVSPKKKGKKGLKIFLMIFSVLLVVAAAVVFVIFMLPGLSGSSENESSSGTSSSHTESSNSTSVTSSDDESSYSASSYDGSSSSASSFDESSYSTSSYDESSSAASLSGDTMTIKDFVYTDEGYEMMLKEIYSEASSNPNYDIEISFIGDNTLVYSYKYFTQVAVTEEQMSNMYEIFEAQDYDMEETIQDIVDEYNVEEFTIVYEFVNADGSIIISYEYSIDDTYEE